MPLPLSSGSNFKDFHNNQLTEFRVYIGGSQIFTPPLKFL